MRVFLDGKTRSLSLHFGSIWPTLSRHKEKLHHHTDVTNAVPLSPSTPAINQWDSLFLKLALIAKATCLL